MNAALLSVALAAVSAPAPAEEAIKPPQGLPPTQVIASVNKNGEFEIVQTVLVPETRSEERTVTIDGRAVKQVVQVTANRPEQRKFQVKGEGVKVYTAAGKEVDAKDVPDKLKSPTIVLLAADGKMVDPFYLKLIKPEALVIVAPMPAPTVVPAPEKVERKKE
jgi:hypothetical protein